MLPGNSRHRSTRPHRPSRRIPCPRGLTLIETLVTFVILGFLSTLILQAVGFFAARYEGVQRVHRVAALESLQQNWFATSVQGFVPYGVRARRFQGHPTYFEGISLEPLNAEAGTPVTVRWSIDQHAVHYLETLGPPLPGVEWTVRPSDTPVRDRSRPRPDTREISNITLRSPSPAPAPQDLAFHYADAYANWYDHWPPLPDSKPLAEPSRDTPSPKTPSVDDVVAALANPAAAPTDALAHPTHDWTPRLIRLASAEEGTIWLARVEPSARPLATDEDYQ
ncbi:MAG: type II secretion system protein [Gammaproteobacteria bacterium]|nr:type II secretion system protein [Gammaproteobacteria bacterium]